MDKLTQITKTKNLDKKVVKSFGEEWTYFKQDQLSKNEEKKLFNNYFKIFPFEILNSESIGFDLGCGSGRWSKYIAEKVGKIICIDASEDSINVAKKNLKEFKNCEFHVASVDEMPMRNNSMDYGYSLGVLHHVPDPFEGIKSCISKLKPGAPFLVYLYYNLENRPIWYRLLWKITDVVRTITSVLPKRGKYFFAFCTALLIYYPITRLSLLLDKIGINTNSIPLSFYKNYSFYVMFTDAYDRFGTSLEHRYSKKDINDLLLKCGLDNIVFNDEAPYWCALGYKTK